MGKKTVMSLWLSLLLLLPLFPLSVNCVATGSDSIASIKIGNLPDFIMTNQAQQSTATFYPSATAYGVNGGELAEIDFIWSFKEPVEGIEWIDTATGAFSVAGDTAAEEVTLVCSAVSDGESVSTEVTIPLNRQVNLVRNKVGWTVSGWQTGSGKVSKAVDGYYWSKWDSGTHSRGAAIAIFNLGETVQANYFRLKLGNINNSSSLRIAGSDSLVGSNNSTDVTAPTEPDTAYNTSTSVMPVLAPRNGSNRNSGTTYWSARSENAEVDASLEQENILTDYDNYGYFGEQEFQYIGILNYAADVTANLGNFSVYDFEVYNTAPNYVAIALPEPVNSGASVQMETTVYNGVAAEAAAGSGAWSAQGFTIDAQTGVLTVPVAASAIGSITYTYTSDTLDAQTTIYACVANGKCQFANTPDELLELQFENGYQLQENTVYVSSGTTVEQLVRGITSKSHDISMYCIEADGTKMTGGTLKKGDVIGITCDGVTVQYKIDVVDAGQGAINLTKSGTDYTASTAVGNGFPEAVLLLAAYEGDKLTDIEIADKAQGEETLAVTLPDVEEGHEVRAMLWDSFENMEPLQAEDKESDAITTYLNRQFTSVATNGRAHGVVSFTSNVEIVDTPSADNKSAAITLGSDGAYFPLETAAKGRFTAKTIYQADGAVTLFAKDEKGKMESLFTLPANHDFETVTAIFDLTRGIATLTYADGTKQETTLSLAEIASLGFRGEGTQLTLNKLFAYSGTGELDDSYFKDYSYQEKAIRALVNTTWESAYQTLSQGVFLGIDFYQASVFGNKLRMDGQPPRVFDGIPYVPAEAAAVFLGGELLEGTENAPVRFAVGNTVIALGNDELYRTKDTNYVTAQRLADAFGLTLSWDGAYLLGFGKTALFDGAQDQSALKDALYYQRPTGEEIFDRIVKNGNIHPRIMADTERLAEVRENIDRYPVLRQWYESLMEKANGYLDAEALYYTKPDGIRLLSVSNEMVSRMQTLGLAYQMTGEAKYGEAAWRDLAAVSAFSDWNPSHYLDVGTMALGVSIGYSWFYDYLTDERKDAIVAGFEKNGLASYITAVDKRTWWTYVNSNWNPWCHGGMLSAIIAMSDRLDEDALYAVDRMFPYMEYLYGEFVPDGAWAEGTAYHATTLRYLSLWCETLETATGKDFGYWDLPGMDVTAYFGEVLSGNGGVYNYGDNTETLNNCEAQEWFATKFADTGLAQLRFDNMLAKGFEPGLYDLLMTHPEHMGGTVAMELDTYYKNMNIVSMRTSWDDASDGFFLAAKGGENGVSHFHYDQGGFVMDVGGVRFAYELGRESYTVTQNDTKTYQYKKRAEGHNTYVINPDETPGQLSNAVANVIGFESKEKGSYAVIDLSETYQEALDMKRGFLLTNDRRTLVIQDEVTLSALSEVYWFMHTQGDVTLSQDGKTAYITKSGVTIRLDILDSENAGATFGIMDALPLDTTPWLEGQGTNDNYQKLFIHWDSVQNFTLSVAVNQVTEMSDTIDLPEVNPMSTWEIPDGKLS